MPREMYSSKVPAVFFCTVRDFAHFRKNWYNMEQRQNKQKQGKVDGIFFWLLSLTTIYIRDVLSDTLSLAGNHFCVYLISVHQCPVHWLWRNQRDILTRRHHPNLSAAFESFQRELGAWRVHLQASRSQAGWQFSNGPGFRGGLLGASCGENMPQVLVLMFRSKGKDFLSSCPIVFHMCKLTHVILCQSRKQPEPCSRRSIYEYVLAMVRNIFVDEAKTWATRC